MTTKAPQPTALKVAVRAHAPLLHEPAQPVAGPLDPSDAELVFDTETTTDETQGLTFGVWRYQRPTPEGEVQCVEEGIFHADDLADTDPDGFETLRRHALTRPSAAAGRPLRFLSRQEWVNQVFYPAAWENRATVVGFNLPFDLSRVAIAAAEGRGRNLRGFSFTLAAGNAARGYTERRHVPRVQVKHLNSHAAFIRLGSALQQTPRTRGWPGRFVDLRTLTFALTARGHSLDSACKAFGLPGKADPGQHGHITDRYIDYCRTDVERTTELYQACLAAVAEFRLDVDPAHLFSPASLSKAVLRRLGVTPHSERANPLPDEDIGKFMSAFYGGRAECRIRCTEVPVTLVDFTSMYPTVFALTDLWPYCTAADVGTEDATEEVRRLLELITLDVLFEPHAWPQLVGIALVLPQADVLPVRAAYDRYRDGFNIGINYFTSRRPQWYTIADVVASTLLTGRPPRVLRALRLTAHGTLPGLTSWAMPGGRTLDPRAEAPWPAMIEYRHRLRRDTSMPAEQRRRVDRFLKITANAGSYGIQAEYNRRDLPKGRKALVDVHAGAESFAAAVTAPEQPGRFAFPPLAAIVTGGARLMLAMLERCVTEQGGCWAFADTDSMAIVATEAGGLVRCHGGPLRDAHGNQCVRALTFADVEAIRVRFRSLNPYPDAVDDLLKRELDAHTSVIAAKRYPLYRYDPNGCPRLVPASEHEPCSHGLGHLLNPLDPEDTDRSWTVAFWEYELAQRLGSTPVSRPAWLDRPAIGKIAITSPATYRALAPYNTGKPYAQQIKPFGFLLHAPGAEGFAGEDLGRLVAPYRREPSQWSVTMWIDLNGSGAGLKITTDATHPSHIAVATYGSLAQTYFSHPEGKAADADGEPCRRGTVGLLHRRHIDGANVIAIGKEANELQERAQGLTADSGCAPRLLRYPDRARPDIHD